MHLSVALKTEQIPIDVPADETVLGLKQKINLHIQVPPIQQYLIFQGIVLRHDHSPLQKYGVESGSVVEVHVTPNRPRSKSMANLPEQLAQKSIGSLSVDDLRLNHCTKDLTEDDGSLQRLIQLDVALNHWELVPGCFRKIQREFESISESLDRTEEVDRRQPKTIIPKKADAPSSDPLPLPVFFQ